jgi:hypothetical protein
VTLSCSRVRCQDADPSCGLPRTLLETRTRLGTQSQPVERDLLLETQWIPEGAPPPTSPRRQPRHSATAKLVTVPGCMRRSFRTLRLCAIPGVSPRAGMRCPVGAHQTPPLPRAFLRLHEAAAGPGRSEHRNVDTLIPLARPRESPTGPNVPCERRTDPAEPPPPTSPRRQPRHSATAKLVRAPKCMRRSFRTLRLCAISGVSPRAGMRCPVGALRTLHLCRAFLRLHEAPAPSPRHPTSQKICETDLFRVNRWDRPRSLCRVCCVNGVAE